MDRNFRTFFAYMWWTQVIPERRLSWFQCHILCCCSNDQWQRWIKRKQILELQPRKVWMNLQKFSTDLFLCWFFAWTFVRCRPGMNSHLKDACDKWLKLFEVWVQKKKYSCRPGASFLHIDLRVDQSQRLHLRVKPFATPVLASENLWRVQSLRRKLLATACERSQVHSQVV